MGSPRQAAPRWSGGCAIAVVAFAAGTMMSTLAFTGLAVGVALWPAGDDLSPEPSARHDTRVERIAAQDAAPSDVTEEPPAADEPLRRPGPRRAPRARTRDPAPAAQPAQGEERASEAVQDDVVVDLAAEAPPAPTAVLAETEDSEPSSAYVPDALEGVVARGVALFSGGAEAPVAEAAPSLADTMAAPEAAPAVDLLAGDDELIDFGGEEPAAAAPDDELAELLAYEDLPTEAQPQAVGALVEEPEPSYAYVPDALEGVVARGVALFSGSADAPIQEAAPSLADTMAASDAAPAVDLLAGDDELIDFGGEEPAAEAPDDELAELLAYEDLPTEAQPQAVGALVEEPEPSYAYVPDALEGVVARGVAFFRGTAPPVAEAPAPYVAAVAPPAPEVDLLADADDGVVYVAPEPRERDDSIAELLGDEPSLELQPPTGAVGVPPSPEGTAAAAPSARDARRQAREDKVDEERAPRPKPAPTGATSRLVAGGVDAMLGVGFQDRAPEPVPLSEDEAAVEADAALGAFQDRASGGADLLEVEEEQVDLTVRDAWKSWADDRNAAQAEGLDDYAVTVSIRTGAPGVAVRIDGTDRGKTPIFVDLAPGTHTVELIDSGHAVRFELQPRADPDTWCFEGRGKAIREVRCT